MLQNDSTLKSLIDKLWQNFWEGGIANPLTAIEHALATCTRRIKSGKAIIELEDHDIANEFPE
jgi:hypothetical protein